MKNLQETLKALSDENRLRIVALLLRHDLCVGGLAKQLGISKAAVSQHLKILREAGVVKGEKRGYFTHYWVDREVLKNAAENLAKLASSSSEPRDGCHNHKLSGDIREKEGSSICNCKRQKLEFKIDNKVDNLKPSDI